MDSILLLIALSSVLLAAGFTFFLTSRAFKSRLSANELTQRQMEERLSANEQQLSQSSNELSGLRSTLNEKQQYIQKLEQQLQDIHQKNEALANEKATLQADYKNLQQRLQEQKEELTDFHQKFEAQFKNLAEKIFDEKSKKFTEQNKTNLGELLNPLRERLSEFQKKVEDSDKEGAKRNAALGEQLKNLRELNQQITQDAKSLTQALRGDSKTQGNWGEMQLERILEKANLQKGTHYRKEQSYQNEEGAQQRLDYIIDLPDGKHLILDSKVSLTAYAKYTETTDETQQAAFLKQHLQSLHNHIKLLSERDYQHLYQINSPDYVLLFVANEPALNLALREDPEIFDKALARNLVLVSSTTLLATLRTISYIWKQDAQNKNAEEIARQAGNLYDKFVNFVEDLTKLGNQMRTSTKTYETAMNKLIDGNGNIVRRIENLKKLGADSTKEINPKLLKRADEDANPDEDDG